MCDFHKAKLATDALLFKVFDYTYIAKTLDPTDDDDFILITNRLQREFAEHAGPIEARMVGQAIDRLDVDWVRMTADQQAAVVRASNLALRGLPEAVLPGMASRMTAAMTDVIGETKIATAERFSFGINTSLDAQDAGIVRAASTAQSTFATDVYGNRRLEFSGEAQAIISDGLAQGLRSPEIALNLASAAARINLSRSDDYWQVVSSSATNRARTYGQLKSFDEARIDSYRFDAVLDERTTNVCRMMDGTVFPVRAGLDLSTRSDEGPENVKEVQPWVRERKDQDGKTELFVRRDEGDTVIGTVEESAVGRVDAKGRFSGVLGAEQLATEGVILPPLHGLCRSTVLPIV